MKKEQSFVLLHCLLLMLALSCAGCSDEDKNNPIEDEKKSSSSVEDLPYEGFVLIQSKGHLVTLGTNNSEASADERPSMEVSFDYDFYLSRHEVTQGEYAALMEKSVSPDSLDYPKSDVTYFDAVLYANALSKNSGLDSVYSYEKANFDEDSSCVGLEGLKIDVGKKGFRLPSEAEWAFAASENWNVETAWLAENSNTMPHEVCSENASLDSSKVCDMAGNLKEWVNDWKGLFKDTTILNYLGASSANGVSERIIKGGSFRTSQSAVSLYSRGDVYTVSGLSKSDYLGFRLALGEIPNPTWLNSSGKVVSSTITPVASAEIIRSLVNSYKAKLVFRNAETGNIAFIDYSMAANSVVEIQDDLDAYHPDVSPNGEYVAFCTGVEGTPGPSSIYVRKLNASGSNLVKLDVENAAIPRFRVLDSGDTVIVYVSNAGDNKKQSEWESYSTWQVPFSGGKFGTSEKLFDGSYHGGVSDDNSLAVTGSTLLRALKEDDGKYTPSIWYGGEQACNVSLATDGSKRTLFLDFSGTTGRSFVGEKYGVHQRIFIADSTGDLVQSIKAPSGFTFDHSEWVAGFNLAVASLTNVEGAHRKLAAVTMNGDVVSLVEGEELWHPSLWAKRSATPRPKSSSSAMSSSSSTAMSSSSSMAKSSSSDVASSSSVANESSSSVVDESLSSSITSEPSSSGEVSSSSEYISSSSEELVSSSSNLVSSSSDESGSSFELNLDSAGAYMNSSYNSIGYALMRYKMELLWKYYDEANVVAVGSSRSLDGVVPKVFDEKFNVLNLSQTPHYSIYTSKYYLEHYVLPHVKNLKYIVIALDLDLWQHSEQTGANFFYSAYKSIPGYVYDENHNYWSDGVPEGLAQATEDGLSDSDRDMVIENRGSWSKGACKGWGAPSAAGDSLWASRYPERVGNAMNALRSIIDSATERDVTVVGVIFPANPRYSETGSFAHYGIQRSVADSLIQEFNVIQNTNPHFVLMDENKGGKHDYTNEMAEDDQHLCPAGAQVLSKRLDSLLLELEKRNE